MKVEKVGNGDILFRVRVPNYGWVLLSEAGMVLLFDPQKKVDFEASENEDDQQYFMNLMAGGVARASRSLLGDDLRPGAKQEKKEKKSFLAKVNSISAPNEPVKSEQAQPEAVELSDSELNAKARSGDDIDYSTHPIGGDFDRTKFELVQTAGGVYYLRDRKTGTLSPLQAVNPDLTFESEESKVAIEHSSKIAAMVFNDSDSMPTTGEMELPLGNEVVKEVNGIYESRIDDSKSLFNTETSISNRPFKSKSELRKRWNC